MLSSFTGVMKTSLYMSYLDFYQKPIKIYNRFYNTFSSVSEEKDVTFKT